MSIPFDLIYNRDRVSNVLPSDKRNIKIIHGVNFGTILGHIHNKKKDDIDSWIKEYEKKLTQHLEEYNQRNNIDHGKYCTNLNSIIDYIVQGINNLNMSESMHWVHKVDKASIDALNKYPSLSCRRDLYSYKDNYLFFKKLMFDLCEDIEYFVKKKKSLKKYQCKSIISRLKYRNENLMKFFYTFYNKSMFDLKDKCSISFIQNNLSNINCNRVQKQPYTSGAPEEATVAASFSDDRADQHRGEGATETGVSQASADGDGLDNPESVDPIPEDLQISLPVNEDPPKLDTTYAAASLAGISLFGTILYKYGPFRNRLNPRRGAINGSNIFPLDNNVYDANVMNNFEYLQTGIPNDEYQVGYGSVTDY